jgi:hypothetical protein
VMEAAPASSFEMPEPDLYGAHFVK